MKEAPQLRPTFLQSVQLTVRNAMRYMPLLQNLIMRELKKKYRANLLSYVWCVLDPLLVMIIMTLVFSRMFDRNIENYPVYLFCGRMFYSFVTSGCSAVMRSVVHNGPLMRKTRVPYYIFPLANFCSAVVDFLFTLVAFAIVILFTATPVSIHVLAFPLVMLQASMFVFGLGLLLAVGNIFIRDINHIWAAFTTAWLYLTPVFYPLSNLSEGMQRLISTFNPLYYFVGQCRNVFCEHVWLDPGLMVRGFGVSLVLLLLGFYAYSKAKDNMILYV